MLLVFGAIFLLVAIGMLFGGGALVWADQTFKDSEGFLTTDTVTIESDSYAITTRPADIDFEGRWPWGRGDFATIKIEGSNNNSAKQIFIGIADESDVEDYFRNVSYDEIKEFRIHPYEVSYRNHPGSSEAEAPTSRTFWVAEAYGSGTRTLEWELEEGTWVLVLMNADGSADVDLSVTVGVKVPWILGVGLGLLIGGVVLLIIAIVMIVLATRRPSVSGEMAKAAPGAPTPPEAKPPSPLIFKGELTEPLSQWLWLVKWLLIIPHLIVLAFLWLAAVVLWVLSFFAILFTGRYHKDIFNLVMGINRWTARVAIYSGLMTDRYPPFRLGE